MADLLSDICDIWRIQSKEAKKLKKDRFQKQAEECWRYYAEQHDFVFDNEEGDAQAAPMPDPRQEDAYYKATWNCVATWAHIMVPFLSHTAPHRVVTPRSPQIPPELRLMAMGIEDPQQIEQAMAQMPKGNPGQQLRCGLQEWWLNYTPEEFDLRGESRRAVLEALVKGRGLLWHETIDGPTGPIIGSFYDSVDNLLIDPSAENYRRDAGWIRRTHRTNVWKLGELFGIDPQRIKKSYHEERKRQNYSDPDEDSPETNLYEGEELSDDVVVWHEYFSRMGLGQNFTRSAPGMRELAGQLNALGDHVYLCTVPGMSYPLNMRPEWMTGPAPMEQIQAALAWPIPFYEDLTDPWPCSMLDFYSDPRSVWPFSPLQHALPLQRFIDKALSFLMNRCRSTSRTIWVGLDALPDDVKQAVLYGYDNEYVSAAGTGKVSEFLDIIQHPPGNKDLLEVLQLAMAAWREATGQDELMFGGSSTPGMRSSAEAQIRQQNLQVRPDDLAECCEDWHCMVARKEGGATRLLVGPETVAPALGERWDPEAQGNAANAPMTSAWARMVNTDNPQEAWSDTNFTIAEGSGRKKNKQKQLADMNDAGQVLVPWIQQREQQGANWEAGNAWMRQVAKALDMENIEELVSDPPPPPDPSQDPEMMKAQVEMQAEQQKAQIEERKAQMDAQKSQVEMEVTKQKAALEAQAAREKAELEAALAAAQLQQDQAEHAQEMRQDQEEHLQEMEQKREEHKQNMEILAEKGKQEVITAKAKQRAIAQAKPKPTASQ